MIQLDQDNKIVIKTDIAKKNIYELVEMKKSVLELISTQSEDIIDRSASYWALELVKLLEPEPHQICLEKSHGVGDKK